MDETKQRTQTEQAEKISQRRDFMRKGGIAVFMTPVVASYFVSDLVKSAKAQEAYVRFSKDVNGIITDSETGLEWLVGPVGDTNWNDANSWVASLTLGGGSWRMPTAAELMGLHLTSISSSPHIDPIFTTDGGGGWSGDSCGTNGVVMVSLMSPFGGSAICMTKTTYCNMNACQVHPRAFAVR